jgi:hypothetical protein
MKAEWRWLKVPRVLNPDRRGARVAFGQERAEGERLGRGPVEALPLSNIFLLGLELPGHRLVDVEALGHGRQRPADLGQSLGLDRRLAALVFLALAVEMRPAAVEPVGLVGLVFLAGLELLVEVRLEGGLHVLDLALGDQPSLTSRSV